MSVYRVASSFTRRQKEKVLVFQGLDSRELPWE
jgi:hypothetical protein